MSQSRLELKVGGFVLLFLVVLGVLVVQFSKTSTWFRPSYIIQMRARNISGLRLKAPVLMAGVAVGRVERAELSPQGTNVTIFLQIYRPCVIRSDAKPSIDSANILGDKYVTINPGLSQGYELTNNSVLVAIEPVDIVDIAHSAIDTLNRIDGTVSNLNAAISDVRSDLLNEKTLTNVAFTIGVLQRASTDILTLVENVNQIIRTNGAPATLLVSNLVTFSDQINEVAVDARGILATNSPQIAATIDNLHKASVTVDQLLAEVRAGHGLAGSLVANDQLATNISLLASNLTVTSSNLNKYGLWHMLWKPKDPPPSSPPK